MRSLLTVFAAVLLLSCVGPRLPVEPTDVRPPVTVESFALRNGLRVVLSPDRSGTGATIRLRYYSGSKDNPPGKAQLAHLTEHLMFAGTPRTSDHDFDTRIARIGGSGMNAGVSKDATDFYETVPRSSVERALWLEADRMSHLLADIDDERVAAERRIVRSELRERAAVDRYYVAKMLAWRHLFGPDHPYGAVDVEGRDLDRLSAADARNFAERHYRPDNAALVVTGDFDAAAAREAVVRYFGSIPPGPPRAPRTLPVVRLRADRRAREPQSDGPRLLVRTWLVPSARADGTDELGIATGLVSSYVRAALVHETRLAEDVRVVLDDGGLGSTFTIIVLLRRDASSEYAEEKLELALRQTMELGRLTEWTEFDEYRRGEATERILAMDDPALRAVRIQDDLQYEGVPNALARHLDRLRGMRAGDVASAISQFIGGTHHTTVLVEGPGAARR